MRRLLIIAILFCLIFTPIRIAAAPATNLRITQIAQWENQLKIIFEVLDSQEAPVSGLDGEQARLTLGGRLFNVTVETYAHSGEGTGYIFAVDISKSLRESEFGGARDAIDQWINDMGENDVAALMTFGEAVNLVSDFTDDQSLLLQKTRELSPTDMQTQLHAGIIKAAELAKRQSETLPARRVTIVLSDGMDDYPAGPSLAEATEQLKEAGVPMYVVGFHTTAKSKDALNELGASARASKGALLFSQSLADGYALSQQRLQGQYVVEAELSDSLPFGEKVGLILSLNQDGVLIEDQMETRLRALTATPTPSPTATPAPATASPTPEPVEEAISRRSLFATILPFLPFIAAVPILAAATAVIRSLHKRKRDKKEREQNDAKMREAELNRRIGVVRPANQAAKDVGIARPIGGNAERDTGDHTVSLIRSADELDTIGDVTEPLHGVQLGMPKMLLRFVMQGEKGAIEFRKGIADKLVLGRKADRCDLVIEDRSVSSAHCVIHLRDEQLFIKDLDSVNHTYILTSEKELQVTQETPLSLPCTIRVGRTDINIYVQ